MSDPLCQNLYQLEYELLKTSQSLSTERLEQLLHADFQEIGQSGTHYNRQEIIQFLANPTSRAIQIADFQCQQITEYLVLCTYRSINENTRTQALRSSWWIQTSQGWQIIFHQGTPTKLK